MVSVQFVDQIILNHVEQIGDDANNFLTTLSIVKRLFSNTVSINNMLYLGFNEWDFFNRFSVDYALTDELHFVAGIDFFGGNNGLFGQYKDNTEIFFKVKYSF
jgi:hypothetical protein